MRNYARAAIGIYRRWRERHVPPDKIVLARECLLEPELQHHVAQMHLVRPASVERYEGCEALHAAFRREKEFPPRCVFRMRDVVVQIETGACGTDTHAFADSYGSFRRWMLERPLHSRVPGALSDPAPFTCVQATGYYHFLLEQVPRLLWALSLYPDLKVVAWRGGPPLARGILAEMRRLGCLRSDVIWREGGAVRAPEYVFTQAEPGGGFVHSTDLRLLRECFLDGRRPCRAPHGRLFISRRHASRCLDNEGEIEAALHSDGFQTVRPERLNGFAEQIRVFQEAAVVVATHGAGLANLVWCAPGTRVVEIFSPRYFNDCYAALASSLGLRYRPLWARAPAGSGWGAADIGEVLQAARGVGMTGLVPVGERAQR